MKRSTSIARIGFRFAFLSMAFLLTACDRGGDGVPRVNPDFVEVEDPNRFLQFLNHQVGLAAGEYRIVAGTQTVGDSGDFTITVSRDDGAVQTFTGAWPASGSGGTDALSAANPSFDYSMPYSGGATVSISSATGACLFLLDSGGSVIAGKSGGSECSNPDAIELPKSKINLAANAQAYYRAIDPDDTRDTLAKWKAANGFGTDCGDGTTTSCERHVTFRDTKDLGYGRDMYARRNSDGSFAIYVRNFRVDAVPGKQYSTLNLDAAIANNTDPNRQNSIQWHFGSNAIEFSTYPYGAGEPRDGELAAFATNDINSNTLPDDAPMFAKFFTFKPDDVNDPNTTERRLDVVNLDSRGDKSMPGPCISCHGGKGRPMLANGEYPPPIPGGVPGDTQAQLQVIEVSTVTFSKVPGWTCPDIIAGIDFINQSVLNTYKRIQDQYGGVGGYWKPDFAADLIEGWYGEYDGSLRAGVGDADRGDFTIPTLESDPGYDPDEACDYLRNHFYSYVPAGWQPDPGTGDPPPGADDLFREVVAPNCMVCHSRRGVNLGSNQAFDTRQDIDFSSYDRFISHAEQVERFIFHKGVMPLGLLNFDAFWDNSSPGRAELLASHLPGFDSFNADGSIQKPGAPYAVAAAPRNTNVPAILSAEGSSFASAYEWSIIGSPAGSNPVLTNATSARATFDTDLNGEYQLQLSVSNADGQTDAVTVDIAVSSALPVPASIRFDPDIKNVLQANPLGNVCANCHAPQGSPGTPIEGVPLYYTDTQVEGRDLYLQVLQRVNFKEPVESLLLRKPSGNHHFGGLIGGFDLEGDRTNYDLFLNWILNGAPR